MDPDLIQKLFPHASASLLNANQAQTRLQGPVTERHQTPALGSAVQGEAAGIQRVTVRFVGYRVRCLDPDNFAGGCKDLLDGLRHAQLIPDDRPELIRFQTEQVRVKTRREEKTVIEIISG